MNDGVGCGDGKNHLLMSVIEQLFLLGRRRLFNSDCGKVEGGGLETLDHCALELFAPELIQES